MQKIHVSSNAVVGFLIVTKIKFQINKYNQGFNRVSSTVCTRFADLLQLDVLLFFEELINVIYHGESQQRTHVVGHQYHIAAEYNHREI